MAQNEVISTGENALSTVVNLWAKATTRANSSRRKDLIRDKMKAVTDFFSYTGKPVNLVGPLDVKQWQMYLESQDLAHSTIYAKISRVSSFYNWAIEGGDITGITHNPVEMARPKAPSPYQNESAQALDDNEVMALMSVVRAKAQDSIVGKRDYALLLFYFFTGKRRSEIINLRRQDIRTNGTLVITSQVKGGDYEAYEVSHPDAKSALIDYIEASARSFETMDANEPLWLVHDRSGQNTGKALSSHGFVKNLKRYGQQAGLDHIHLHQTRHTAANWTDSITEAQELLGHKDQNATRIYKRRLGVKKDTFSSKVAGKLGLE
jgi:integrase